MARLVTGHADGSGGGRIVDILRQADHIGPGIEVVRKAPADPLNAYAVDTVGGQHPLGCLGTGDPADGILLGIPFEGGIDIVAGPHGEHGAHKHQQQSAGIMGIIVVRHNTLLIGLAP